MLSSFVKHLGSGRALKKWGKTLATASRVLPYTSFVLYRFLNAFNTTEQSTVEASSFVKCTD